MAKTIEWDFGDVYLKSSDKEGRVTFTAHRAWHGKNFVRATHLAAAKEGGSAEQITQTEFIASRGRK